MLMSAEALGQKVNWVGKSFFLQKTNNITRQNKRKVQQIKKSPGQGVSHSARSLKEFFLQHESDQKKVITI